MVTCGLQGRGFDPRHGNKFQVLTKNEISMRKSWYRFVQKQKEEWREFAEIIGLKNSIQQLAVGAALCILLLAACGAGEWLSNQF